LQREAKKESKIMNKNHSILHIGFNVQRWCYLLCLAISILVWSCQSAPPPARSANTAIEAKEDAYIKLRKEVMTYHNETMKNMDTIVKLKIALKTKLATSASIFSKDSAAVNIKRLEKAHDIMMDWMHNYKEPDSTTSQQQKMAYMRGQLSDIQRVKVKMNESIWLAAQALKKKQHE
jgi:hypothetical protein